MLCCTWKWHYFKCAINELINILVLNTSAILFQFIQSLSITDNVPDENLIQKICAAIDVNSFEVRGPPIPAIGCAEVLRGVYLKAALLAHDCTGNTSMSINDNNTLICHASNDIKKGDILYYNYTDPLKVWYDFVLDILLNIELNWLQPCIFVFRAHLFVSSI